MERGRQAGLDGDIRLEQRSIRDLHRDHDGIASRIKAKTARRAEITAEEFAKLDPRDQQEKLDEQVRLDAKSQQARDRVAKGQALGAMR